MKISQFSGRPIVYSVLTSLIAFDYCWSSPWFTKPELSHKCVGSWWVFKCENIIPSCVDRNNCHRTNKILIKVLFTRGTLKHCNHPNINYLCTTLYNLRGISGFLLVSRHAPYHLLPTSVQVCLWNWTKFSHVIAIVHLLTMLATNQLFTNSIRSFLI